MEIRIYSALFDRITSAVEKGRPETFAAHTKGFRDTIAVPWSYNTPQNSVAIEGNASVLDYDARGKNFRCSMAPKKMTLSISIDTFLKRHFNGLDERSEFHEDVSISGAFEKKPGAKSPGYALVLGDFIFEKLQPLGIRELLSWLLSGTLSASISDTGFPERFELIKNKLFAKIGKPQIESGYIAIKAALEKK